MSYLSFENNIIEASGNLILKSTSGVIDCSGATISHVIINGTIAGSENIIVSSIKASNEDISFNGSNLLDVSFIQVNNDVSCSSLLVDTIGSTNHDISFNGSNLLDVSFIQVNNEVSCNAIKVNRIDATDISVEGNLTVINTIDLDISDNIIGLNRGHTGNKNTSGMLINYEPDVSNIFFGYHKDEDAFVIADTSYNHDDVSRNIVVDKFVDLKVGKFESRFNDDKCAKIEHNPSSCFLKLFHNTSDGSNNQGLFGFTNDNNTLYINKTGDPGRIYINAGNGTTLTMHNINSFSRQVTAPIFSTSHGKNMISTQITDPSSNSDSYIQFNRFDYYENENYSIKCRLGYIEQSNNVFHIISDDYNEHIQLKRQISGVGDDPYLNIGEDNGSDGHKHKSNVMIEAPTFKTNSITSSGTDISFNSKNLVDVNNISAKDVYIDGSLVIQNSDVTLIHTKDLDISDNIIGLNRGHTGNKNTSGMLINYDNSSNIFFGYHKDENAFVIADTSYNHDDDSRNIILDKYVDLKVGNFESRFDNYGRLYSNIKSHDCYLIWKSSSSRTASIGFPSSTDGSSAGSNQLHITCSGGFYINSNDNLSTIKGSLVVTGQITALSFNAVSDYRTKTNIEQLDENISVSNLRPLVYLKNGQKEIGLLAHELQEVYPFMVCGEKDGKEMQSVNYIGLIGVLINDVKRLTNENQILKLNNDTLKSDYDTLKSRLDSFEDKFNKKFE
jgi:hypothetical protein